MDKDFTTSIAVNKTPAEVYEAIKDVKSWWVGEIAGDAKEVGSKFTYRYKHFHECSQTVTELIPNKRVVWHVTAANIPSFPKSDEWVGTDIIFDITPKGEQTEVKFTHRGLTPQIECYEACSGGWGFYINKSLKNFILEGVGLDPGV
ncbi:MAG: SRPBCC domain-containing protein [Bdellovibrio sp.]|nr:SRPBCC domain-containing protein [Bdellovibrio sp.]